MEASQVAKGHHGPVERRPRVLIVDDDPGIRLVCSLALGLDGYDVTEAANGQEALDMAFAGAPDVVLLDISMPVLDGFGVAAALRADARTRTLPFVFLTGELDSDIMARGYNAGAAGFFSKPFDPAAVAACLRGVLEKLLPSSGHPATGGHAV